MYPSGTKSILDRACTHFVFFYNCKIHPLSIKNCTTLVMQKGSHHSDAHVGHSQGGGYDIGLWTDPANLQSSKSSELSMIVTEQQTGGRVGQFEIIHDKLMHLVVVSDDLSYFAHVHPKFNDREKVFAITHTFPAAGRYRMWVDVKPKGAGQLIKKFDLNVDGKPARQPIPIVADRNFAKDIVAAGGQKHYRVQLKVPERINAGKDTEIVFELSDSQGRPITDLEPLMAAGGHCVIISSDAEVSPCPSYRGGGCRMARRAKSGF